MAEKRLDTHTGFSGYQPNIRRAKAVTTTDTTMAVQFSLINPFTGFLLSGQVFEQYRMK